MIKNIFLIIFLTVLLNYSFGDISPQKNWRYKPAEINASHDANQLDSLLQGKDARWGIDTSDSWLSIKLEKTKQSIPLLFTFGGVPRNSTTTVYLESSLDSKNGNDGTWNVIDQLIPKWRLEKFTFSTSTVPMWYRMRFDAKTTLTVTDIGLYNLDGNQRKDYWLIVGASIQAQSIRNTVFKNMVQERFPDYDPIVFNLAVSGWRSGNLRIALPDFLKDHPYATYVGIHIGGNNVTPLRPYPGGADKLKEDLIAIIKMVQDSGKIPILSRLSYRAYKGKLPVPPEENGSGPYVENIYDPLIEEYCPLFFDKETHKGKVNAYDWFKEHQDELRPDGVHVIPKGEESWNRLWVEGAGPVIYTNK